MMRAAPLALTGLLGLILLEILKVIAEPLLLWALGLLFVGFKIFLTVVAVVFAIAVVGVGYYVARRMLRTSGDA